LTINSLPIPTQENIASLELNFILDTNTQHISINGKDWNFKNDKETSNKVTINDNLGNKIFGLTEPVAIDSNNNYIPINYTFKKQGASLYISLKTPYEWLINETRVFPIIIDPTLEISAITTNC
jgi:hypothetical protein